MNSSTLYPLHFFFLFSCPFQSRSWSRCPAAAVVDGGFGELGPFVAVFIVGLLLLVNDADVVVVAAAAAATAVAEVVEGEEVVLVVVVVVVVVGGGEL